MEPFEKINERVEVITVHRVGVDPSVAVFPAKMKYKGREVLFTELGLRHPTLKGKRMVHVFDVSDGSNDFRLEYDAERLTWTLIEILPGHYRGA
jgi:hypothetical protein